MNEPDPIKQAVDAVAEDGEFWTRGENLPDSEQRANPAEQRAEHDRLAFELRQITSYADALNARCVADTAGIGRLTAERAALRQEVERLRADAATSKAP